MHNFESNYEKIMEVLDKLDVKSSFLSQVRVPKLSDRELVCINLTSEYTGIDSERQLFRHLPPYLSSRIERSVYNRRKRKLFPFIERIRQRISEEFNRFEDVYVVDSMPLEVCKLSRSSRSKVCREQVHSSPNKGYCASQGTNYYGYKLHAVCSASGVFKSLDISPASVHDVNYLKDIRHQLADCTLLGDGGCLSSVDLDGSHTPAIRGGEKTKTTNALYLADRRGLPLAMSEPVAGNHNDLFDIQVQFEVVTATLVDQADIKMDGLFLNADAGFDSKDFRRACDTQAINANVCFNKRNGRAEERD